MTGQTPLQRLTDLYVLGGYGRQSAQLATDLLAEHDAGKDTRDAAQAPAGASTLGSDVLDLLAAIRDALTVPRAAPGADFTETMDLRRCRDELLADRATTVRIATHVAVDLARLDPAGVLSYLTQSIRHGIDAAPVDYEVRRDDEDQAGGEPA